jgi:hypothetical protein
VVVQACALIGRIAILLFETVCGKKHEQSPPTIRISRSFGSIRNTRINKAVMTGWLAFSGALHQVWPPAAIGLALAVNLAWIAVLAYGIYTLF